VFGWYLSLLAGVAADNSWSFGMERDGDKPMFGGYLFEDLGETAPTVVAAIAR
jgi:hypothetical protein